MPVHCFVSYEIHPTTWGGAGVLLHHAAERLLREGHEVVFLLDVPVQHFRRFEDVDRKELPHAERCRAYHVDALCDDFPLRSDEVPCALVWKALRFDHALDRMQRSERRLDFVEFFEYCGVGYYAFVAKLFGRRHRRPVLGTRTHNTVELIDLHEATKRLDRDRHLLYALERAALPLSEVVLVPSARFAEAYYLERYGLDPRGVEVSEPPIRDFGRREGENEGARDIVYYGRVFEFKGVERFVRAALLLLQTRPACNARFVLIGPESRDTLEGVRYGEQLRSAIPRALEDRFVFTGHLDHRAVQARLGDAIFAVFPNRFESFCYALHELYDAGLPVLLADIPAFRTHFRDGDNALFFDNTTEGLALAMGRLVDDPALRQRLANAEPLSRAPLGAFYDRPRARLPLGAQTPLPLRVSVVVLVPQGAGPEPLRRTLDALQGMVRPDDRVLVVREAEASNAGEGLVQWLGALRRFETPDGVAVAPSMERTGDAVWLLVAGDVPSPEWLELCRSVLAREPRIAFAGSWTRDAQGRAMAMTFDVASELYPFEHGTRPTRALVRTEPRRLLAELFDGRLGALGEVGLLWDAELRWGRGVLLPELLLETADCEHQPARPEQLAFLVMAKSGPRRCELLARLCVSMADERTSSEPRQIRPLDGLQVGSLAWEHLNGQTLARMAARKLHTKMRTRLAGVLARLRPASRPTR